jgi:hypothetical protein
MPWLDSLKSSGDGFQTFPQPPVSRVSRVPGMPVHCLVNIRQFERRIQRPNVRRFGKTFRGALQDKTDELRSLNQKGNKKKAF